MTVRLNSEGIELGEIEAELLRQRTVAGLAAAMDESRRERSNQCIVPIRPVEGGPSLFCICAVSGLVLYYREMAEALDPTISVHGIQAIGGDGQDEPLTTVAQMARRLRNEGEDVLLLVVDALGPALKVGTGAFWRRTIRRLRGSRILGLARGLVYRGRRWIQKRLGRVDPIIEVAESDNIRTASVAIYEASTSYRRKRCLGWCDGSWERCFIDWPAKRNARSSKATS